MPTVRKSRWPRYLDDRRLACRAAVILAVSVLASLSVFVRARAWAQAQPKKLVCDLIIEDFATTEPGAFPKGWRTREEENAAEAIRDKLYVVEQTEVGKALHATYGTHTITVVRRVDWDLVRYPYLQWRWKAVRLPKGGDETSLGTNDSAASVYVGWEASWPIRLRAIRYAWSSTKKVGTRHSRRFGADQILVVESGSGARGKWRTERVDVRAHYRDFYDRQDDAKPALLALTTDADATESSAEAYYADFRACRVAEP